MKSSNKENIIKKSKNLGRFLGIKAKIMEVCGTHTMAISKYGIRGLLPGSIGLISGPGCPVCVTEPGIISTAIKLAKRGITIATFGDMMRVPSLSGSLQEARAGGADVKVIYSPLDSVQIASENHNTDVCFFAVGFETTAPAIALSLKRAVELGLENFSLLTSMRVIPPAMEQIVKDGNAKIDGFIAPGHVSTIIGSKPYVKIARDYKVPIVISGFSSSDIITSIDMLLSMIDCGESEVKVQYDKVVKSDGNEKAKDIIERYFTSYDIKWRGLGIIKGSGLAIRDDFSRYDALIKYNMEVIDEDEPEGCRCGDVLSGKIVSIECPLFGQVCTPSNPVGPCMVSSEGSCSAYYKYGGKIVK
ncbi:MAG: hydrogenase formation protein HypD [bacterium]